MLSATFLAIFFVPLFFVVVLRLFRVRQPKTDAASVEVAAAPVI
jgi:multidrug efflux pump